MSFKSFVSALASSSLLLVLMMSGGPVVEGQTTKAKAAAKAKLDLNKATAEELADQLPGVGEATAKKIVAGRPYTTVDDLAKAGVPARTINGIRDHVTVSQAPAKAAAKAKASTATAPGKPVDLNSASAEELETLPGIGPTHAKEIIAARPFKSVDDLERVKGIGKARIDALRAHVTAAAPAPAPVTTPAPTTTAAKPAVKAKAKAKTAATLPAGTKVNINTASKEELDVLPGIGPVKAQAIIDGRPFKTIEDIKKVKGIKDGEFGKIKEMITVE